MKKLSSKEVKRLLPFTIQEAKTNYLIKRKEVNMLKVSMYQNENTTPQQFHKLISKILQF